MKHPSTTVRLIAVAVLLVLAVLSIMVVDHRAMLLMHEASEAQQAEP